jgi:hypothetical protein
MRRVAIALALATVLASPPAPGAEVAADEGGQDSAAGGEAAAEPEAEAVDAEPAEAKEAAQGQGEESEAAESDTEAEEEEEEPGWFSEYGDSVRTRALTGLNGLATAPADPVMAAVEPPKAFAKAGYLRRPLGFGSGVLLMLYRAFSGVVDLGMAVLPELPVVSPVPRYKLVPGFEHDDE